MSLGDHGETEVSLNSARPPTSGGGQATWLPCTEVRGMSAKQSFAEELWMQLSKEHRLQKLVIS